MAWFPTFVVNFALKSLGVSRLMYKDFMGVVIYGRLPIGTGENLFAYFAIIGFLGFLGSVFAYVILGIGIKNYLLKGMIFGLSLWFSFYSITMLYKVPQLRLIPLGTAIGNFIGASTYGLCMAFAFRWLDKKVEKRQDEKRQSHRVY